VPLDVGFIYEPAVTDAVSAWSSRLDDQRGEALHPPVDRDVINLDAALGEQFFDISVRESVSEVPAHRQQDHVGGTGNQQTTGKQDGDDESPAHATTHTQSVNATVPPQPENGMGSRFASKPSETPIQRLA
jgi:hypothetical protein